MVQSPLHFKKENGNNWHHKSKWRFICNTQHIALVLEHEFFDLNFRK